MSITSNDAREFVCGWGAAVINVTVTYPINKIIFRQVSISEIVEINNFCNIKNRFSADLGRSSGWRGGEADFARGREALVPRNLASAMSKDVVSEYNVRSLRGKQKAHLSVDR